MHISKQNANYSDKHLIKSCKKGYNLPPFLLQVQLRHANYEAVTLASSDVDTSLLSRLKALGHNNPMSIPFANFEFKAGFTVDIEGGEYILHYPEEILL